MSADTTNLLLDSYLKTLKLPAVARAYPALEREAADKNLGYAEFLKALLEQEVVQREQNQLARRLKAAQFPWQKTLDEFEFSAVPTVNKNKILSLADSRFVRERENAVLIGNPGVGKTHLAVGIGRAACQAGHRVAFRPVPALVNEMLSAQHEYKLNALLKRLRSYDLVICDEFRYIPFSTEGAQLLFQFFSHRHSY